MMSKYYWDDSTTVPVQPPPPPPPPPPPVNVELVSQLVKAGIATQQHSLRKLMTLGKQIKKRDYMPWEDRFQMLLLAIGLEIHDPRVLGEVKE